MKPRFTHDCGSCKFLGTWNMPFCKGEDLYICIHTITSTLLYPLRDSAKRLSLSIVSRFGNEGYEYRSLPWMNNVQMPSWAILAVSWALHLHLINQKDLEAIL